MKFFRGENHQQTAHNARLGGLPTKRLSNRQARAPRYRWMMQIIFEIDLSKFSQGEFRTFGIKK